MTNLLSDFSNELASAAGRAAASVVTVHGRPRIASSGIVWRNGLVLTSDAGLRRDEELRVTLPDGKLVTATLKGRDGSTDVALLACDTGTAAPVTFTNATPQPGALILTVGRTAETGPIVTWGVVSGVSGTWQTWRGGKLDQFVRLDTAAYPTSIGGAVVDSSGGVLGMVAGGLSRSSVLAITRGTLERVAEMLLSKGRVARGYIGVGLQTVAIPASLKQQLEIQQDTGVMALSVEENGPAARAGLMLGDVLLAVRDQALTRPEGLHMALDPSSVGQELPFTILRGTSLHPITVKVAERPSRNAA
ncbi:MAG TPA: hypothetical protein DEQ47_11690 [Solibacterales bacterium]|jgi:S1-C subfamily serine protease|nr:hypothetical protein [Bryobacterales bacterium]